MPNDLSTFIAELSVNNTDEDRENTRARLQRQFDTCDFRLNELVQSNREVLSSTVKLCSKVISTVETSRNKCRDLKGRISSCMNMLQCNRENLRKMWLESLQHKYAHKILSEIEELRKIPKEVNDSLINNKLEHATDVIVSSIKFLNGKLCDVDGVKELKLELQGLQEKLYSMVLEDLRKHLHLTDFINNNFQECLKDVTYDDVFSDKSPRSNCSFKNLLNQVCFDNSYVTVLLNCLVTMNKLTDAVEILKENCKKELIILSENVSKFMYDIITKSIDVSVFDLPKEKQHAFLIDLTENVIFLYQKISSNYKVFVGILQNIIEMNCITDLCFEMDDVYSKVQVSVDHFIGNYLELNPVLIFAAKEAFNFDRQGMKDIGTYFTVQSLPEDHDLNLFKFSKSCHGLNMSEYSKEADIENDRDICPKLPKTILICRPTLRNITVIFNPLKQFISEIEKELNLDSGAHCPVHVYLYDAVNLFLNTVNSDINKLLRNVSVNLDAWNISFIDDYANFRTNSEKQILSCNLVLSNILIELQNLIKSLPDYTNHFLHIMHFVVSDYKDMYQRAFKLMFEEEQNILSVSWARDQDIRRLMKSFLNWRHLEDDQSVDIIESPEEIRLRNKEESELLIRNLRSEDESSWDIISEPKKLANLALLQENLIWFSIEVLKFIKNFTLSQSNLQTELASESNNMENNIINSISGLRKIIKEYEDFADMCLLALHLEVRARCFHYLLTYSVHEICVEGSFVQDFDTAVKQLTSDLQQIDEVLLPILTSKELKYVFEGLGELVASLMILIISNMNKINENVVRRIDRNIFIVQCCLANITMTREVSLERARQFIDLLKSTHEEILDQIVEEGPLFNELEYASVFRLISSTTAGAPQELGYYLKKLDVIFKRLNVDANDEAAIS